MEPAGRKFTMELHCKESSRVWRAAGGGDGSQAWIFCPLRLLTDVNQDHLVPELIMLRCLDQDSGNRSKGVGGGKIKRQGLPGRPGVSLGGKWC